MAKKKTINKSAAIRSYMAKNPSAGPKAVQEALAKKGITITESLVSHVKYASSSRKSKTVKKKMPLKKKAPKRRSTKKRTADRRPLDDIKHAGSLMMEAVELVTKAGATEAKHLINLAADMVKKIRE